MLLTLTNEANVLNPKNCGVQGPAQVGGIFFFIKKKWSFCRHFVCQHYVPQHNSATSYSVQDRNGKLKHRSSGPSCKARRIYTQTPYCSQTCVFKDFQHSQSGKTTAVRETGIRRHHGRPIKPYEHHSTIVPRGSVGPHYSERLEPFGQPR